MKVKIDSNLVVYEMSAENEAVASCESGDEVIFVTKDCNSNQLQSEEDKIESLDFSRINPATGPLAVKGAEVGDVLKVFIKEINIADQGVMMAIPEMGILDKFIEGSQTKIIPIKNGKAVFNDQIKIPIDPMIGVIGTTPRSGAVPCGTPGSHGGNMDTKVIKEGATIYLPVNIPGGLLAMGDLHAVMGDGEVVICGVEISGEVTVEVSVIKSKQLTDPMVETDKDFYTIASAPTLDEAAQKANDNMFNFLNERLPLANNELAMLMSLICDLQVSQVVDPAKTARMKVSKDMLNEYRLKL